MYKLVSPSEIKLDQSRRFSKLVVTGEAFFVRIVVGGSSVKEKLKGGQAEGGIRLQIEGMEPQGVTVSIFLLPEGVTDGEVDSLNYAFTLLSEKYEPWRSSHTDNIYERMF